MKVGIIGVGNIGAVLARKLANARHDILIANSRGADTLRQLADETGTKAVSVQDATKGVDAIVLSIPFGSLPLLRQSIGRWPDDVVVADTSN